MKSSVFPCVYFLRLLLQLAKSAFYMQLVFEQLKLDKMTSLLTPGPLNRSK